MAEVLIPVLLVGCLIAAAVIAGEQEGSANQYLYNDRTPTPEELTAILRNHQEWLESGPKPNNEGRPDLSQANFQRAYLVNANLQRAYLYKAQLQGAYLMGANLQRAYLYKACLKEASLGGANLQRAYLYNAQLQGASLDDANLEETDLIGAQLQGASLDDADLAGAIFEIRPESLPNVPSLARAANLYQLTFRTSPHALVELREALKEAGLRTQERQITYAIEHTTMLRAWDPLWYRDDPDKQDKRSWLEKLTGKSESLFSYVLFELPSAYGMAPWRALVGLVLLIVLFSLVYMVALFAARGRAGMWATWPTDRVYQEEGTKEAVRVTDTFLFPQLQARAAGRWWGVLLRGLCIPLIGLYFSILSAFSLGWRELNVGTWIARVQPREYTLRPTGWVRTVSGIQSLLSVYLLALWVLTYFGRPFE
jgi:hypothetical protein